jgi:hypothetical protein
MTGTIKNPNAGPDRKSPDRKYRTTRQLHHWNIMKFRASSDRRREGEKPHFGASHSLKPKAMTASVPTPPSQSAANHNRRCASGRVVS